MVTSQMQHTLFDFLDTTLVHVVGRYVPTYTTSNVHLAMVVVLTVGAFPDVLAVLVLDYLDLSIIAADLAVV